MPETLANTIVPTEGNKPSTITPEATSSEFLTDTELETIDQKMTQGRIARSILLSMNGSMPQDVKKYFEEIELKNKTSAYVVFSPSESDLVSENGTYPPINYSAQELITQFQEGQAAMNVLVERNLPFAKWVTSKIPSDVYQGYGLTFEDIYGYAVVGLIEAAARYRYSNNVSFINFAYGRVRGQVIDMLREFSPLNRQNSQHLKVLRDTMDELNSQEAKPAGAALDRELEKRSGLKKKNLSFLLQFEESGSTKPISLNNLSDTSDFTDFATMSSSLLEKDYVPEPLSIAREEWAEINQAMKRLTEREQSILTLYYGKEELKLREIATRFKISEARVRQIHAHAIARLKATFSQDKVKSIQ